MRAAYRAAARRAHPDAGGSAAAMRDVNLAGHVLNDPGRRAAYDRALRDPRPAPDRPRPAPGAGEGDRGPPAPEDLGHDPADLDGDGEPEDGGAGWVPPDLDGVASVEGWLAILPAGVLVLAAGFLFGSFLFMSPALLVFAVGAAFLSLGLFVLVPLVAMVRREPRRDGSADGPGG